MKPFNPNPLGAREQWVRTRSQEHFHLRDSRVPLPNVRVICGAAMPADQLPFEIYQGSAVAPYGACPACLEKASVAA